MSRDYFEGWYYKHQSAQHTVALIPGRAKDGAFLQVITQERAYNIPYPLEQYHRQGDCLRLGNNVFTPEGIQLELDSRDLTLRGKLSYHSLTPIRGDIMGPFRFFPMECRHGVVSMRHTISGCLEVNGTPLDLTGGLGYIERDSGCSFPSCYTWIQANDFDRVCSIMVSIAEIPFMGLHFQGCICAIHLEGRELRLATYRGVRVLRCAHNAISLRQGRYRLDIQIDAAKAHALSAPHMGAMSRIIKETAACPARFRLSDGDTVLFEGKSERASHEYVSLSKKGRGPFLTS